MELCLETAEVLVPEIPFPPRVQPAQENGLKDVQFLFQTVLVLDAPHAIDPDVQRRSLHAPLESRVVYEVHDLRGGTESVQAELDQLPDRPGNTAGQQHRKRRQVQRTFNVKDRVLFQSLGLFLAKCPNLGFHVKVGIEEAVEDLFGHVDCRNSVGMVQAVVKRPCVFC